MRRAASVLALVALLAGCGKPVTRIPVTSKTTARLSIPPPVDEVRFDFEDWKETDWSPAGKWQVREVDDAPSGKRVLERAALDQSSPSVTWSGDALADVEVSLRFRFTDQAEKTETGIVLRESEGCGYAVRVGFQGQIQLSGCESGRLDSRAFFRAPPVPAKTWRTLAVVAIGDQIQAQMDGVVCWTTRDARFKKGRVGLWWAGGTPVQVDDFVVRTHVTPVEVFEGLDWDGVAAQARQRFFAWANREPCPCGSGRTLASCRKSGCAEALERGKSVLEQCEEQ